MFDDRVAELGAFDFGGVVHQAGEVIRHSLGVDGAFHALDDQVRGKAGWLAEAWDARFLHAKVSLVWAPSKDNTQPFYSLWEVQSSSNHYYVDWNGNLRSELTSEP